MTAPDLFTADRFKDGYASAERHWKARWHQANDDLQKAISENERLRTNLWALQEQDERAEIWREKANQYHARLAAVEALADRWSHCGDPGDPRRKAATALRAALETDTTKETP